MSLNRTLAGLIDTAGDVKSASLDNAASLTVYATKEDLPSSGMSSGDQAYVTGNSRFYISNGSGWYNVALVNATPSLSIDPTGAIELSTEGATTIITLTATDSDNAVAGLTYSVESDGSFGGLATLSQDSSVFTITPLSEDSATTVESTLTFKASDGISFGSGQRTFTLTFRVQNSNYTTVLLKADTTGTDNQVDASSSPHAITEVGAVTSTAFTPHHPGGYSTYFDGTDDYLSVAYNANLDLTQTSTATVEAWIYLPAAPSENKAIVTNRPIGVPNEGMDLRLTSSRTIQYYETGAGSVTGSTVISLNTWTHVAAVKTGGSVYIYINGTLDNSGSFANGTAGTNSTLIGRAGGAGTAYFNGYIRDLRIVNGTAVYTTNFTPPTEPLTAIANTSLLACHLPYFADGSTNGHAITVNGDTSTKRFGPFNYLSYEKADYGGSVWYGGAGNSTYVAASSDFNMPGDFTWEAWIYPTTAQTNGTILSLWGSISNGYGFWYTTNWTSNNFGSLTMYYGNYGSNESATSVRDLKITLNAWHHVAISRSGTSLKMFINGKEGTRSNYGANGLSWSDTRNFNNSSYNIYTNGSPSGGYDGSNMYVADARMTVGTAWYTADFTPPTEPLTATNSNVQYLSYTNKNDIWNAGTGNVLTKAGNVTSSNTQRKFISSSAVSFDGSGDSISITAGYDDPLYNFGTHDWTLEGWFYIQTLSGGRNLFSFLRASANEATPHVYTQGTDLRYYVLGSDRISGSSALTVNTWHHIAATRSGNDHKLFVDGTQVGSTWTNAQTYVQGRPVLGDYHTSLGNLTGGTNLLHGYAQDFRITKGLARYTANFTPPTAEFGG
jgi:hypothetical protein